jgi:hypothetical protein
LKTYLGLTEDAPVADIFEKLDVIKKKARKKKVTMQRWLYGLKDREHVAELHDIMKENDPTLVEYFNWQQIANRSASSWLSTLCSRPEFEMKNDAFRVALCLRYHKKIPFIDAAIGQGEGQVLGNCPCCRNDHCVDQYGHHFISGCLNDIKSANGFGQKMQIHAIHDQLRYVLYRITKHANARSVQEPMNLLHNPTSQAEVRPDLLVTLAPTTKYSEIRSLAVDLAVVCPFQGSKTGILSVGTNVAPNLVTEKHINARATNMRKTKTNKYAPACAPKNKTTTIQFVPFIINTTGKIDSSGMMFLKMLADHAAETRNAMDPAPFLNYYLKMLSISLMNLLAATIRAKAIAQFSRSIRNTRDNLREGNRAVYSEWITRSSDRFIDRGD